MFESIYALLENVNNLDSDKICVSIYKKDSIQKIILTKNRIDQLTHGLNTDSEIIGVYTPITDTMSENTSFTFDGQSFEKIAGQPYNFVDTGEFFSSFVVNVYEDGFTISANDVKEDGNLTDKYGNNILGLDENSKSELIEAMLPIFQDEVRKLLFT